METATQPLIDFFHKEEARVKERRPQAEAFVKDRFASLAGALGDKDYLEGHFTVADLMMSDVLRIIAYCDLIDEFPRLKAYRERCEARPAFQRAMKAQLDGFRKAA